MRKALQEFAEKMEEVLKANEYKGGWDGLSIFYLWESALKEMVELRDAIIQGQDKEIIIEEACDVANFIMMLADNVRRRRE